MYVVLCGVRLRVVLNGKATTVQGTPWRGVAKIWIHENRDVA